MFKHDTYTAHLFGLGGPRRIVITDRNITQKKDLTLFFSKIDIKNDPSYDEAMYRNWGWLKPNNGVLEEETLKRMRFWQNKPRCKNWIFLCNPNIVEALKNMGIRDEFINWQVPNTEELDNRLVELYGDKYDSVRGVLNV